MQFTSSLKIISVEIQQETSLGSKLNILIETYSHLKCKSKMQFYPINFFVTKPNFIFVYPHLIVLLGINCKTLCFELMQETFLRFSALEQNKHFVFYMSFVCQIGN